MLFRHARSVLPAVLAAPFVLGVVLASPASATPFSDTVGSSAEEAVDALAAEGIVNGCREGEFCPREPLTRGQMASVIANALQLPAGETLLAGTASDVVDDASPFADVGGSVHEDSINAIAAAGITQGCGEDAYCPQETITRGQMATMLVEAFDLPATDEQFFDDAGSTHGPAIHRLGAAGVAAGCGDPLTAFCTHDPVLRGQSALFLARTMGLIDRVELSSLDDRREQQAKIDAEAKAAAEAAAKAKAEADAAAARLEIWEALARCESGYGGSANWSINTGNGFYGGLQFSLSSWRWVGGSGYPHQATKTEQIKRGELLLAKQGWGAWPTCSRILGYR